MAKCEIVKKGNGLYIKCFVKQITHPYYSTTLSAFMKSLKACMIKIKKSYLTSFIIVIEKQ